jgi:hypothetical protein
MPSFLKGEIRKKTQKLPIPVSESLWLALKTLSLQTDTTRIAV